MTLFILGAIGGYAVAHFWGSYVAAEVSKALEALRSAFNIKF